MVNRTEHPRPNFVRPNWMSLDGAWSFAFDDRDVGVHEQWFMEADRFDSTIEVPFLYDCPLSGISEDGQHNTVWYHRTFVLPEEMRKHTVLLHFSAVSDGCEVYVNTFKVGEHAGGHTPFCVDITDYVSDGENDLCVRACRMDSTADKSIGIHRTVYLEAAGKPYLTRVHITPDLHQGMALVEMTLDRVPKLPVTARLHVTHEGQTVAVQSVEMHGRQIRTSVDLSEKLMLWTPETPNLYDVSIEVSGGDSVVTYFGMRSTEIHEGRLCINGKPYFLRMASDLGEWTESGTTPPNREALHTDVRRLMRFGFNAVLKYGKAEDARYYYRADRAGLPVFVAMPGKLGGVYDAVLDRGRMIAEAVDRDYNSPCIVAWMPEDIQSASACARGNRKTEAALRMLCEEMIVLDGTRPVLSCDAKERFTECGTEGEKLCMLSLNTPHTGEDEIDAVESIIDANLGNEKYGGCIRRGFTAEEGGLVDMDRTANVDMMLYSAQLKRFDPI